MAERIKIYVAAGRADVRPAAALGAPVAWLLYRVGEDGRLMRAGVPTAPRGGLMGLTDRPEGAGEPEELARAMAAECARRGFEGVLLDLGPGRDAGWAAELAGRLDGHGLACFAPPALAGRLPRARVLIPSALSGGAFDQMLDEAKRRFEGRALCLEVVRMCHSFALPAESPGGVRLSAAQLRAIIVRHRPTPYFSPEMLCRYFTYREEGQTRFVLFDDTASARAKLARAAEAGFKAAFLLYGEWGAGAAGVIRG